MRKLMICAGVALALSIAACGSESDGGSGSTQSDAAKGVQEAASESARVELVVSSPDDYSDVHRNWVRLRGTVDPADATVTVNGDEARVRDGEWSRTVRSLDRGENEIEIQARAPLHEDDSETMTIVRKRSKAEIAAARQRRIERAAQAEASFRSDAKQLDYDALLKNPERFDGTKAVFNGKVLQAREDGSDGGFMLIETSCDEYDICDDLVYVAYDHPISASADDRVTVYGTITGGYEYDTQAGGSNFVPSMHLRYIDE